MAFYQKGRDGGPFEAGIEFALRFVLASPAFVFRAEDAPANVRPGAPYQNHGLRTGVAPVILPVEQHSRRHAAQSRRRTAACISPTSSRGRSSACLRIRGRTPSFSNFAGQWLQLRNLKRIVPNSDIFPDFDDNLRQAFEREAELFFTSIVREDRSVLDLMTADYTFRQRASGAALRHPGRLRQQFPACSARRSGALGTCSARARFCWSPRTRTRRRRFCAANGCSRISSARRRLRRSRTCPRSRKATRGRAADDARADGAAPSQSRLRRLPQEHGSDRVRAGNFDAVGAWRATADGGVPLNTADRAGGRLQYYRMSTTLRRRCCKRPSVFVQTLTEKLMVYGLGRGLTYEDGPAVRRIVRTAEAQGNRFSAIVIGIVTQRTVSNAHENRPTMRLRRTPRPVTSSSIHRS